nr:protein longifolia 1-like [Tanacetum cinerariifolium]
MSHTKSSWAKVRSLNALGVRRRSKYSNVQQNAEQPEAVGEPKKASYGGTQVSREVVMAPEFSEEIDASMRTSSRGKVRSLSAPGGRRRLK